ncbi:Panacea domain-containing protein [Parvularcula sp. IMCC14364]|uniref:Panacea domain-containing protein n=1 Tax=Parvularcula sp. IMCC14364 TaxID=3067902 RepID=UPI00274270FD|nr:Panacea domain-containing protein [Parvularcula sp. IMCC14364]
MSTIKFRFAAEKALNVVTWMLNQEQPLDLHTVLKACYFADKESLKRHGLPVFGASYRAMTYGPVPLEIYEMLKGEPMWLAELSVDSYPWQLHRYFLSLTANEPVDLDSLLEDEADIVRDALALSKSLTFDKRTAQTHGPDWQKAKLGMMNYEDMIDDVPHREEIIEELQETSNFVRL